MVGVPDAEFGQVLAAFVVKQPRARLSAEQVRAHVREHLARFKVPKTVDVPRRAAAQRHRQDPQAPTGNVARITLM